MKLIALLLLCVGICAAQTTPILVAVPAPIPSSTQLQTTQQFYFDLPLLAIGMKVPNGEWSWNIYKHAGKCASNTPLSGGVVLGVNKADFVLLAAVPNTTMVYRDSNVTVGHYCYARTLVVNGVEGPLSAGWETMLISNPSLFPNAPTGLTVVVQ